MQIKELQIQNFKSFGNDLTTFKFGDNQLILLQGNNGSGKSAIQQSLDLALFRQVRGKNKDKISATILPNRINKRLLVNSKFINHNNDFVETNVCVSPSDFKIKINEEDITDKFKKMSPKEKEKIIGFNYKTFKSFISMSVNDFLNFISLSTDDKRNLLNKLFNLEELDEYLSITKEILKINNESIDLKKNKIQENIHRLNSIKDIIKNLQQSENKETDNRKEKIKEDIKSKQIPFKVLNDDIKNIDIEINDIENKKQSLENIFNLKKDEILRKRFELNHCNDKIKIFESGKCPSCDTSLNDSEHKHTLSELIEEKNKLIKDIDENKNIQDNSDTEIKNISQSLFLLNKNRRLKDIELSEMKIELRKLKQEYDSLKDDNEEKISYSIDKLKIDGKRLLDENKILKNDLELLEEKSETYQSLIKIFGNDGIRKDIISNVIIPINQYLNDYLNKISFLYNVELNGEFNAIVYERDINEIHSESLSTGEEKIINIMISLSYLKLIRKAKNINLLFLDEVFNSISNANIDLILKMLKDFCQEMNINIIVVHHGMEQVNLKYFDRVISLTKNFLTEVEDYLVS